MNTTDVKLQLPLNSRLRDDLTRKAEELGFDSAQALLRYVAKALVDGRKVTFGEDDWGEPTDEAAARINTSADEAKHGVNVSEPFYSAEEALKHLRSL